MNTEQDVWKCGHGKRGPGNIYQTIYNYFRGAKMYQRFEIIGRVVAAPEMKYTPDATPIHAVTNFTVAVNEKFGARENTVWVRVSTWNGLAEVCNKYVTKGMLIFVEGRINVDYAGNPRTFIRKDGTAGASLEMTASTVKFLSKGEQVESADLDVPF